MESTRTDTIHHRAPLWRFLVFALVTMMVFSMGTAPASQAQDATEAPETPDVVIPGTGDEPEDATPEADPTEEATEEVTEEDQPSTSGPIIAVSGVEPGNPAVIAHGLAFLSGNQAVWQVREVEPKDTSSAAAEVSNASFVYQVEGTSIIRNDVTGKRALLDPGEAYFKAGGDAYTTIAESSDSLIWIFEVVGPGDVQEDAFYESPLIDDYSEGVFDLQLIRYVLQPGDAAELPDVTGPSLVMSTNGDIDIESGGLGLLATGDGQLITQPGKVTNNSAEPVEFVVAAFGAEVGDESSGPGSSNGSTPEALPADAPDDTPSTDEPVTEEEPAAEEPGQEGVDGVFEASINITAQADLYVVIVADGVTVFDGPIPDGGQSGIVVGSTFEVYTSYGAATVFTDACGEDFVMGYEEGEASYVLNATAESCAP